MFRKNMAFFAFMLAFALTLTSGAQYTVKSGDVLWKIAENHGITWQELAEHNNLANPGLIYPGQIINLPKDEPTAMQSGNVSIEIIHTNDIHGRVLADENSIGYATIAQIVADKREAGGNVLLLDAGDAFHGSTIVNLNKGSLVADIMNIAGYDAIAIGNHDFNYGSARLTELGAMTDAELVAANILGEADFADYVVEEIDGVRIAIVGISTPETAYTSHPDNTAGLEFVDPIETFSALIYELEQEADVIIALAHLGEFGQFTSQDLARAVPEIDVIIDGHSHSRYSSKLVNGVLLCQAGEYGENLGIVNLQIRDEEVVIKTSYLMDKQEAAAYGEHEGVLERTIMEEELAVGLTSAIVGTTDVFLDGERENVRTGETNLGNLVVDAMLDSFEADCAIFNGGSIRASIDVGEVTVGEVLEVLPFENYGIVLEISGADIKAALEHGYSALPEQSGGFAHIGGMIVVTDMSRAVGSRVVSLEIGGEPYQTDRVYKLVTNDFLASGGDGYDMLTKGEVIAELEFINEMVEGYIGMGKMSGEQGRIVDVSEVGEVKPAA